MTELKSCNRDHVAAAQVFTLRIFRSFAKPLIIRPDRQKALKGKERSLLLAACLSAPCCASSLCSFHVASFHPMASASRHGFCFLEICDAESLHEWSLP